MAETVNMQATGTVTAGTQFDSTRGVADNYRLRVQLGNQDVAWTPQALNYVEIYEYLDRLLPAFQMSVNDATGILTHLTPYDSKWNTVSFMFGNPIFDAGVVEDSFMKFRIYRRRPEGVTQISNHIVLSGLLDISDLFSPRYQRGWVKTSIQNIIGEICGTAGFKGFKAFNVDRELSTRISIVQPNWSNAMFLNYLTNVVTTANPEAAGYHCFTSFEAGNPILNFTALTTLLQQTHVLGFTFGKDFDGDLFPIYTFECVDNFEILNMLSIGQQVDNYFDYKLGEQVTEEINLDEVQMKSLSYYYGYDKNIDTKGISQGTMDRTTDLVPAERQMTQHRGKYYKRLNALNKMWITTAGNTFVKCGDIVKIVFLESSKNLTSYQYTGYWMVERIVHHIAASYLTRYLLTRPGVDGGVGTTTLMAAAQKYGTK